MSGWNPNDFDPPVAWDDKKRRWSGHPKDDVIIRNKDAQDIYAVDKDLVWCVGPLPGEEDKFADKRPTVPALGGMWSTARWTRTIHDIERLCVNAGMPVHLLYWTKAYARLRDDEEARAAFATVVESAADPWTVLQFLEGIVL